MTKPGDIRSSDDVIIALTNAFCGPSANARQIHTCRESLYALRRLVQSGLLLEMKADFHSCTTKLTLQG